LGIYLYNADVGLNLGDRVLDAMGLALPVLCYIWLIWERAQLAAQIDAALGITADRLGMKLIDPQPTAQKIGS
jgi:hypothetical protein